MRFFAIYCNLSLNTLITKYKREVVLNEMKAINTDNEDDVYESSICMSHKYLEKDYLKIGEQAQKGFAVTISVSIGEEIIIVICLL